MAKKKPLRSNVVPEVSIGLTDSGRPGFSARFNFRVSESQIKGYLTNPRKRKNLIAALRQAADGLEKKNRMRRAKRDPNS